MTRHQRSSIAFTFRNIYFGFAGVTGTATWNHAPTNIAIMVSAVLVLSVIAIFATMWELQ